MHWITCEEDPPDSGYFAGRFWSDANKRWVYCELRFHRGKWSKYDHYNWCICEEVADHHWLLHAS